MKDGDYKVFIYYIGTKHPTIINRGTLDESVRWVGNKHNRNHFKGCDKWQIQDKKGNIMSHGKIDTETIIKIVTL